MRNFNKICLAIIFSHFSFLAHATEKITVPTRAYVGALSWGSFQNTKYKIEYPTFTGPVIIPEVGNGEGGSDKIKTIAEVNPLGKVHSKVESISEFSGNTLGVAQFQYFVEFTGKPDREVKYKFNGELELTAESQLSNTKDGHGRLDLQSTVFIGAFDYKTWQYNYSVSYDSRANYYFRVDGSARTVDTRVVQSITSSGDISILKPDLQMNFESTRFDSNINGAGTYEWNSINYAMHQNKTLIPKIESEYKGELNIKLNEHGKALLGVSVNASGAYNAESNMNGSLKYSVYADPFFEIDPEYAALNPGTYLTVLDGVGNSPVALVPEPEKYLLLIAGLLIICLVAETRKNTQPKIS